MTFERKDLFSELLSKAAPLAKAGPRKTSAQEEAERKAAETVRVALEAQRPDESVRAFARRLPLDQRTIRDIADGNRRAHLDLYFRLRKSGQIAFVRALIAAIPEHDELEAEELDDDSEKSARCA